MEPDSDKSAIVVGGGVAGMSAACALAEAGLRVKLVERRGYLGGRASSYRHPGVDEVIDNCQHVLFGCCTNLIGFYRRIGVAERIHWTSTMTMIEPGGRRSLLGPSRWAVRTAGAAARAAAADDGEGLHARGQDGAGAGFRALMRPVPADSRRRWARGSSATGRRRARSIASGGW